MSSLNFINSHELETKGNCKCLALGGNTFVSLPDGQEPLISIQIDDNKNFSVYFGVTQEIDVYSSVFVGKWKCCKNLFVGVALQPFPGTTQYKRLTLEIDPATFEARYRVLQVSYVAGDCLSSSQEHVTFRGPIHQVVLQPVVSNCGADFIDPVEPQ